MERISILLERVGARAWGAYKGYSWNRSDRSEAARAAATSLFDTRERGYGFLPFAGAGGFGGGAGLIGGGGVILFLTAGSAIDGDIV
jgi:hypothetical protein